MRVASLFSPSAFVTALTLATIPVTIACSDGVSPPDSSNHQIQLDNTYWTELGLDGHWLSAISETPWGLFAGTLGGGVFRLEPSDGKWVPLGLDHAQIGAIAFVPGSPDRLLVGVKPYADEQTDAAVFASEDGGATWAPSDDGLAVRNDRRFWSYSLAVAPTEPAKVFWGGNASILRSEDGGRHWSFVYGAEDWWGPGIGAMTVAPGGNGRVWAGGMTAIFLPTVIRMDAWGDTVQQLFISPNNENSVYSLALDPRNPDRLLAGMMGGVLYSDDDAETWNLSLVVDDLHGWSTIEILPMPDLENDDYELATRYTVDNTVDPHTNSKDVIVALEFARAGRMGLGAEGDHACATRRRSARKPAKLLLGRSADLKAIPSH